MDGKTEVRRADKETTVAKSYNGKEVVESHQRFECRNHIKQEMISISLSKTIIKYKVLKLGQREVYRAYINYYVVVILT